MVDLPFLFICIRTLDTARTKLQNLNLFRFQLNLKEKLQLSSAHFCAGHKKVMYLGSYANFVSYIKWINQCKFGSFMLSYLALINAVFKFS